MHDLSLFKRYLVELPVHSRADRDGIERQHRTKPVEVDLHVALACACDDDGYGARPAFLASCLAAFDLGLAEVGSEEIVRSGSHEAEHQQPKPRAALMRTAGLRLIVRQGGRGDSRLFGCFNIHRHRSFQGNDYRIGGAATEGKCRLAQRAVCRSAYSYGKLRIQMQDATADGNGYGLRAVRGLQLGENGLDLILYGARSRAQAVRNFLVAETLRH